LKLRSFTYIHQFLLCSTSIGLWGCQPVEQNVGVAGKEGRAYFNAQNDAVFAENLMVGSYLRVGVQPIRTEDAPTVLSASFVSADPDILDVTISDALAGEIDVIGPGMATLNLVGEAGDVVDSILIKAVYVAQIEVLDALLFGTEIDPVVPREVAILNEQKVEFGIQARDRCGDIALSVEAIEVSAQAQDGLMVETEDSQLFVEAVNMGSYDIQLRGRKGPEARLNIEAISSEEVNGLEVLMASANPPQAELWGRSFSWSKEVIGLVYEWSSEDNVTLSNQSGTTVIATLPEDAPVASEEEGSVDASNYGDQEDPEPESLSSATVQAQWGVLQSQLDLRTATYSDAKAHRIDPDTESASPRGCGDAATDACDPYSALLLIVGTGLQKVRRRRRFHENHMVL
jgi:hypothetical protein